MNALTNNEIVRTFAAAIADVSHHEFAPARMELALHNPDNYTLVPADIKTWIWEEISGYLNDWRFDPFGEGSPWSLACDSDGRAVATLRHETHFDGGFDDDWGVLCGDVTIRGVLHDGQVVFSTEVAMRA